MFEGVCLSNSFISLTVSHSPLTTKTKTMNGLISTSFCKNYHIYKHPLICSQFRGHRGLNSQFLCTRFRVEASTNELDKRLAVKESKGEEIQEPSTVQLNPVQNNQEVEEKNQNLSSKETSNPTSPLDKDLQKVVQKTAATFAPRASIASKNLFVPGTALYTVFEMQGYVSMLLGGAFSFNLIFPSNDPDIWRLMGMWSIWMFSKQCLSTANQELFHLSGTDCSKNEKEALNYLFLLIPFLNVIIPFFWKSFAVVWSADT